MIAVVLTGVVAFACFAVACLAGVYALGTMCWDEDEETDEPRWM
jgi:hypothetical protein